MTGLEDKSAEHGARPPVSAPDLLAFLVEKDVVGFAVVDEHLVTRSTHGRLSAWIPVGEPICQTALFTGLEADLIELRDGLDSPIVIPNVGLGAANGQPARLSVELYWDPAGASYVVLVHRLGGRSELEYELVKQVRARKLAERNFSQAKIEARQSELFLDTLAHEAPALIAMLDTELAYMFATAQWATTFGLDKGPFVGRAHAELVPQTSAQTLEGLNRCCRGDSYTSDIEEVALPDGRREWVIWRARAWHLDDGSVGGVFLNADLRSEDMGREQDLRDRSEKLRSEIKRIDELHAILAHDFRAPLRTLRRELESLADPRASAPPGADGDRMVQCTALVDRLERMVSDLQEHARIDTSAGTPRKIDLGVMLQEIANSIFPNEGWRLETQGAMASVLAAPAAMDIVLRNLIDNAVKHHDRPAGTIRVSVERRNQHTLIAVEDDGPGVPSQHLEDIFRPYWSLCRNAADNAVSTGMGLAAIRKVAALHHWTVTAVSDAPRRRGLRVEVALP